MTLKVLPVEHGDPWYANGLKFTCTQCGNCCTGAPGYVWISSIEVGRLAEFFKLTPQEVLKRYCRKIGQRISLKEHCNARGDYDCIFLKEIPAEAGDGSKVVHSRRVCEIYPVRPLQCRTWPFWDGNLASEENWQHATNRCPGMNHGKRYTLPQIHALRDATDWPEQG